MTDTTATATQRRSSSNISNSGDTGAVPPSPVIVSGPSSLGSSSGGTSVVLLPLRIMSKLPTIITILIRVFLWPVFKIANLAFPSREFDGINNISASDRAARAFVTMFQKHISTVRPAITNGNGEAAADQEHYVEPACPFSSRGYNSTLGYITSRPPNSRPLLLLYLHSPLLHGDNGTKFIREYLCHSQLLQLLNANNSSSRGSVVCFGASIHTADGQMVRDMMGVTSFPFMALLNVKSSTARSSSSGSGNSGSSPSAGNGNNNVTMELLLRMEGPKLLSIPPAQVTVYLNTTITRHAEVLAAEEARRLQREEEQQLREEQNREFQETLLADQMREIERREAAEREQREREAIEEAERLKRAKEESRLEDAKSKMGEEPPAGEKGVASLRFTLPNGKRVDRRFIAADTIETIRAFLIVHFHEQGIEMKNFSLSTSYPRKTFDENDDNLTLDEAGLTPQAVVMVQDLDS